MEACRQNLFKIPDDFWLEVQNMINDIEIAFDTELIEMKEQEDSQERVIEEKRRSSSRSSSPQQKSRKERRRSKKDRRSRSSSSDSLERIKNQLKKRLKESELLDEIERLEAEKQRRLQKKDYEPFKINMPDMDYQPVPSTSKDVKVTHGGYILKPSAKPRSRSKSIEPFISGPMELVIPKDLPQESHRWRRRDYRDPALNKRKTDSFVRRRSPSPMYRRRSRSPYGKKDTRVSRSPKRFDSKSSKPSTSDVNKKRDKKSRWAKKSPSPVKNQPVAKPTDDDEDWDAIVETAPKTSGAGYDIEEVKSAGRETFNFRAATTDIPFPMKKGKENVRKGKVQARKSNRVIRIDDDDDVVLVVPGKKGTNQNKPDIPPPYSNTHEIRPVSPMEWTVQKKITSLLPLFAPAVTDIALPEAPLLPPSNKNIQETEDGELHSDDEQLLPPGCEPEDFSSIPIPQPVQNEALPPPPPPPPALEALLPPGVDAIEQDTVQQLVKKPSHGRKLREKFDLMVPERDEDEFLPPPFEFFIKPLPEEAAEKNIEDTMKEVAVFIEEKRTEIKEKLGKKVENVPKIAVEGEFIEKINEKSSELSIKCLSVDKINEKSLELSETCPSEDKNEELEVKIEAPTDTSVVKPEPEPPIPDVDDSRLLPASLIKEKQDEDAIYSRIKESIQLNEPPAADISFLVEEYQPMEISATGLLCRECDGQQLPIIPESLIQEVITSLHVVDGDRHLDEETTTERLCARYFWPYMTVSVHDFIVNCTKC